MNQLAIFSDGTQEYRRPCEPEPFDTVTLRIRTALEKAIKVSLVTALDARPMKLVLQDNLFAYYEAELQLTDQPTAYCFLIEDGAESWYYNREGLVRTPGADYMFVITPGFHTPDWTKGAVMYQIFVDRFFNGDTSNDVEDHEYIYLGEGTSKVKDWYKYPDAVGIREFYGGDLSGVIKKLDYLKDLGIQAIYLNPIFVSPSNHKYDTQDYDYIDPHFGSIVEDLQEEQENYVKNNALALKYKKRVTNLVNLKAGNELFIQLVEEAHKRDIKVILDGVFNHCGSFHKWLDRESVYEGEEGYEIGAYKSDKSPYKDYFLFQKSSWPENDSYEGWWGYETLPKLHYEGSKELYDYILKIGQKWVSPPYNCDGWRLDVAADLGFSREFNHTFWKDFRKSVKAANPEAVILAEHYGNPKEWLTGDEWDTVMNYDAFMEPLTWFLTGMEKHSDEYRKDLHNNSDAFFEAMKQNMVQFQTTSLFTAMNELSNHDHSRFLTRTNHAVGRVESLGSERAEAGVNKGILKEAVTVQMTWPGAPTIYYGDEAGLCGFTDPDNRRTYPWGREDQDLIEFHREIIKLHNNYKALRTGSLLFLDKAFGFISYGRFAANDKFIVAINNNAYELIAEIRAWIVGIRDDEAVSTLLSTTEVGYTLSSVIYYTEDGILRISLPPYSSVILKNVII
ncbi:maltodextrin glucosidase [Anaerocolumna cellulosilytica]|uniref:Maltodextrin glucosidase n=1 Tax=Anaerocolumna cellulosilytica TaxID=433286 RepID=A0A6S6QXP6_9FIRM|nr:glycoside hydrolase family 13 protein [Anaerocolumna cellulosilytica]MBB5196954.1 alpha-glucosidase [Anaerocolumna cellulosilytica]BCJ92647.1 maltodextrin glucosidase [Anaerocolumna cellulosilytica]